MWYTACQSRRALKSAKAPTMLGFEMTFSDEGAQSYAANAVRALNSALSLAGPEVLEGLGSISVKPHPHDADKTWVTIIWLEGGHSEDKAKALNAAFIETCNGGDVIHFEQELDPI